VNKGLPELIRAVRSGQKRIPPEIALELAEHTTEGDLSAREIAVLRWIAAENATKEIASKRQCRGNREKSRHQYPRQTSLEPADSRCHHRAKTRNYRALIPRKRDRTIPVSDVSIPPGIFYSRDSLRIGDPWIALSQAILGAALALIGPGAWSIDARRYGRKRIELPER
jgi:hypothetical protein